MNADLMAAALSCFAAGLLIDVVAGVAHVFWRRLPYLLALAGSVCLVVLGARRDDRGNHENRHLRSVRRRSQRAAHRFAGRPVLDASLRHRRLRLGMLHVLGGFQHSRTPPGHSFGLRAPARLGRGDPLRSRRLHVPLRLGALDPVVLHVDLGHASRRPPGQRRLVDCHHREGQWRRIALRVLVDGGAYPQLEYRQLARHRTGRDPRRRLGSRGDRVRGQGWSGAPPGVDPRRLPGCARPSPGGDGGHCSQRRRLRIVALPRCPRPTTGLARARGAPGRGRHCSARDHLRRRPGTSGPGHRGTRAWRTLASS